MIVVQTMKVNIIADLVRWKISSQIL